MKLNNKQIVEMIREAVASYLQEMNYNDRMAALKSTRSNINSKGEDEIIVGKVIGILDNMRKNGVNTITMPTLQKAIKSAIKVSAPLGKGTKEDEKNIMKTAQDAGSPTKGQPVMKPPAWLYAREGKIQLTNSQLKEMISKVVAEKLSENALGSHNPIMAKREIIALMDSTARSFEQEIIKAFKLRNPEQLPSDLQKEYLRIVESMKMRMVEAAMDAVHELINFPKEDSNV